MKKVILFILLTIILSYCGNKPNQPTKKEFNILIVHFYPIEEDQWLKKIDVGIMDKLKNYEREIAKNKNIVIRIKKHFIMSKKGNADEDTKKNAGKLALQKVNELKPTKNKPLIVIATDDNAQKYFARFLIDKKYVSIVFCGVNADPKKYGYPAYPATDKKNVKNVTGILERNHVRKSISLLETVLERKNKKKNKKKKKIKYTLLTDKGPASAGFIEYLKSLDYDIEMDDIIETDSFEEWKEKAKAIKSDAIIIYRYHTLKDKDDKPIDSKKVIEWTFYNVKKPSIGFFDFAIKDGVLIGNVESGFEHGELAAKKVIEIMNGKKAGEISITTAKTGLTLANGVTAKRLRLLKRIQLINPDIIYKKLSWQTK